MMKYRAVMKKLAKLVGIGIVLVLLGAGIAVVANWRSSSKVPAPSSTAAVGSSTAQSTGTGAVPANVITYTDNGFSPATLTVEAGSTVTIRNESSETMQFNSDDHPVHGDDADLNVGTVRAGESKTFTVTKKRYVWLP